MDLNLARPAGLDEAAWAAIEDSRARLERAVNDGDHPLAIGTAKDLAEAVARTVLGARGETVVSSDDFGKAINGAHSALHRQPGIGLTDDPVVRNIAQSSRNIVLELPAARNRCGTGHGRAVLPDVSVELVNISVSGALLWARWALNASKL